MLDAGSAPVRYASHVKSKLQTQCILITSRSIAYAPAHTIHKRHLGVGS